MTGVFRPIFRPQPRRSLWVPSAPAAGIPSGASTGGYDFAGSATGTAAYQGASTGGYAFAGSATGSAPMGGASTGGYAFAGSAIGSRASQGFSVGGYAFAGSATGSHPGAGPQPPSDVADETIQFLSQEAYGLDINGGLRVASGLDLDRNGVTRAMYGKEFEDSYYELVALLGGGDADPHEGFISKVWTAVKQAVGR